MAESSTLTALNTLIHKQFSKDVIETFDQSAIALNWMKKVEKDKINSQKKEFSVMTGRGGTMKGAAEYDDFPAAVAPTYSAWLPQLRYVLGTGSFSHLSLIQNGISGVNGKNSIVNIGRELGRRISDEYESWLKRLSAMCYRDGKGKISSAITARTTGASGTITVAPSTADFDVELFSVGLQVTFYDSSGNIHNQSGAVPVSTVTAVNRDTGVVTFDTVPTDCAIGDFPVYYGSYDAVPFGFTYNIQNSDTTINGLNVTGLSQLKSLVQSRSGSTFSIQDVNKANVRVMKFAGTKSKVSDFSFFMNPVLYNGYLFEAYAQSTIQTSANRGSQKVDLLYDSADIGGTKIMLDNDAPRRQLIAVKRDTWRYFCAMEPGLVRMGDTYLHLQNAASGSGHKTGYNYYLAGNYNMVCLQPAANYRLTDYTITDNYF